MTRYYDYEGQPITHDEWIGLFRDDRVVARTRLDKSHFRGGSALEVSSVWIGISWDTDDALIYETMVFLADADSWDDLGCWRWRTRQEALEGHEKIVREIESGTLELHDPDLY